MARTVIGEAAVKPDGVVRYRLRAETTPDQELDGPRLVGDSVDELLLEDFLDLGFELRGRLQNPGDRAEILAVE